MLVSIIIPTFNEKDNIIYLVKEINKEIENYNYEIIVVDDNSPDCTIKVLKEENLPYVVPILRKKDHGFAKSIRCGIENARGNIIIIMDSDFNHNPKYLPILIENTKFYDCVVGSRFLYSGKEMHHDSYRTSLSWMYNLFIRLILKSKITENLFGYIAIRQSTLLKLNFDKVFVGYGEYYIRLMFYLQLEKASILQIPTVFSKRKFGEGNPRYIERIIKYTKETLKIKFLK